MKSYLVLALELKQDPKMRTVDFRTPLLEIKNTYTLWTLRCISGKAIIRSFPLLV